MLSVIKGAVFVASEKAAMGVSLWGTRVSM